MQTALRKMGNSTGLIVPRVLLGELGVTTGAAMDIKAEDGRLIVTPIEQLLRAGWADDAAAIGPETAEELAWTSFGIEYDDALEW